MKLTKRSLVKIINKAKEDLTFFYDSYKGVKGFYGTSDIFFVCQKPSTGKFPSQKDKMFYRLLKKYGFRDAHITDLVKTRGQATPKISNDELKINWPIFEEEINLLKPKALIALGNDAYIILKKKVKTKTIKIFKIPHYSNRYNSNLIMDIEKELKKIRHQLLLT